jgi:hypothetical protein
MNLEEWVYAVKYAGSKKSKYNIRKIIKEQCLFSNKKIYGAYQIDGDKVWKLLIENDENCKSVIHSKNVHNYIDLESYIDQVKYRSFWSDNKRAYGKKRR